MSPNPTGMSLNPQGCPQIQWGSPKPSGMSPYPLGVSLNPTGMSPNPQGCPQIQQGCPQALRAVPKSNGEVPNPAGDVPKPTGAVPKPSGMSPNPAGTSPSPQCPQENYEDPHKTPASPVVHIRGLIDGIVEADLVEALQEFGPISYVVVMPKKRQALVEFEDILGACNAVNYAADNQIYFAGHPAFVNYSTSQKISRPGDSDDARGVNNVLLFTILNPIYSITTVSRVILGFSGVLLGVYWGLLGYTGVYWSLIGVLLGFTGVYWDLLGFTGVWGHQPMLLFTILNPIYSITTDVLYTICNPCGPVQRIVIFRKNGVQAMVEFDSVQSAQRAKASLNGADIYSGCCTLKIEYAKPSRLNVFKNDQDTWDYTNPNLSGTGAGARRSRRGKRSPLPPRGAQRSSLPPRDL
uniref:RRM domain-containing protein n=1 Tax=Taeniopygia guttata TaxID=59729 RepID=A0A674HPW5_TAEGU